MAVVVVVVAAVVAVAGRALRRKRPPFDIIRCVTPDLIRGPAPYPRQRLSISNKGSGTPGQARGDGSFNRAGYLRIVNHSPAGARSARSPLAGAAVSS